MTNGALTHTHTRLHVSVQEGAACFQSCMHAQGKWAHTLVPTVRVTACSSSQETLPVEHESHEAVHTLTHTQAVHTCCKSHTLCLVCVCALSLCPALLLSSPVARTHTHTPLTHRTCEWCVLCPNICFGSCVDL